MSAFKFLIDTNIVIGLEDDHPIEVPLAELARKCSEHSVRLFVHGAVYDDVKRDRNVSRRTITLSKLEKFELLRGLPTASSIDFADQLGPIKGPNDRSDVQLLLALNAHAVNFLITEDIDLQKRAKRVSLGANVVTVKEALEWLRQTFEPKTIVLPYVVERRAYEIDRADPLFDSLREGYPGFDDWFEKCAREHRDCWVVEVDGKLAGIAIRKDEKHSEAGTDHSGPKILKICTFKMRPEFRGEKFGEQLLKQILWFAQRNSYDLVYITSFPDQKTLLELLTSYGFQQTQELANGELVLEKPIIKGPVSIPDNLDFLTFARRYYPRIWIGKEVRKFCVPIRPDYHRKLFPEIAYGSEIPLFPPSQFGPALLHGAARNRTPGNTIRKVYLCRAKTREIRPGDLLFFYMSKDEHFQYSQSITSVGVVEKVRDARTYDDLVLMTAKRSVFSGDDLQEMISSASSPVLVIDFLLVSHSDPAVSLQNLVDSGVFRSRPPQSIAKLTQRCFEALLPQLHFGFEL